MKTKRLNKTQVAERRRKVSEWANSGWTQQAIAAALNVSQATVSRDLEVFNEGLRQETIHNLAELRNRQLYKLDLVEAEAWAAWRRSQQPVRAASITDMGKGTDGDSPARSKKQSSLKHGHGDPRFLDQVRKCVAQRCKIMGVELPTPPRPAPPPAQEPGPESALPDVDLLAELGHEQLFELIVHASHCTKEAKARALQYARERATAEQDNPPRPATTSDPSRFSRSTPPAAPHGGLSSPFEKQDVATGRQLESSLPSQLGGADGNDQQREPATSHPPEITQPGPALTQNAGPSDDIKPQEELVSPDDSKAALHQNLPTPDSVTSDPPGGADGADQGWRNATGASPPETKCDTVSTTTTGRPAEPCQPGQPAETNFQRQLAELGWDAPWVTAVREA